MDCPKCNTVLRAIEYEGIEIEACEGCGGEWLDGDELDKVIRIREVKFNKEELRAIAESTTIRGVRMDTVDRGLSCPGCGWPMEAINYGGETGIILDRCKGCGGFWLDAKELEQVQMVVEGWEDALPSDLKKHGATLRKVEVTIDREDDVTVSRLPIVGRFINSCINGILDLTMGGPGH